MFYTDPPSRKQIIAMDSIIRYLPHLKEERNKCDTSYKASQFISKYGFSSYEARATEKGHMNVRDFLKSKGINVE